MSNRIQESATQAVQATTRKIVECVNGLSEETIRWKPTEEEWSIMQILAHVAEAVPFWVGEIRNIIKNPNEAWGRNHLNEIRLQAVSDETINTRTVGEVLKEIQAACNQAVALVEELTDDQLLLKAPCRNPRFEGENVEFILNHLIVEHAEKHYGQIQRNLTKWAEK